MTCRACLGTNKEMIRFDETFVTNYNVLTNLDVSSSDGLSQFTCNDCWETVNCFIDFRTKCITSESVMKSAVVVKNEPNFLTQNISCANNEMKYECDAESADSITYECFYDNESFEIDEKSDIPMLPIKNVTSKDMKHDSRTKTRKRKRKQYKKTSESLRLPCGICEKSYQEKKELFHHLEDHKEDKTCEICQEIFFDWPEILSHRLKHIPKDQRRCHLCSKYYISYITMEYHYRKMHYNGNRLKLKCSQCQRSYETPIKLKKHVWSVHSNKVLICDYCSKTFNNKQKLKIHILAHTSYKGYVCDICGYSCKYSSGLKDHKIRKHTAKKVYCKTCARVFQNQQKHDKHICVHSTKLCPVCGKNITKSSRMSRHLETHRNEKRFKCDRCPASYKCKTALQVHRDRHDGNRTKQCEFCPAKFYSATVLIKHRRIHTGERPYVCKICQRSFTGNSNLKVHMKVHGEYLINKKIKPEDLKSNL